MKRKTSFGITLLLMLSLLLLALTACGEKKCDHSYQGAVTKAATCESDGVMTYTCSLCTDSYTEVIKALGHDEIKHDAKDPTCTEIGWDAYVTCSRCDYSTYAEKAALNHDLEHHDAKAPTCTEIGWDAYVTCSRCDYSTYAEKPALTHDEVSHEAKAPTCTEIGWDAYVTCSRCDYTTYVEKVALTHDEISHEAKAPTCTEVGWDAYVTCSHCDYSTYAEKPALTHDEVSHEAKAPTCTEIGWDAYVTCSRCDYTTYVEKVALTHDEISHEAKAPTCTEVGWDAYVTCSRCDYSTYVEKAALTHDEVKHDSKAPTCTEIGWDAYVTCSRCDYTTYAPIEETGHSHDAVVNKPTCTEKGYTTHTCHCGDTYVDTYVDALGHTEVTDEAVAPTCTKTGLTEGSHCSVCNTVLVEQKTVDKLDHDYSDELICNSTHHYYECECGSRKDEEKHISSGAATPTQDEVCTVCGYVITKAVGISFKTLTVNGNNVYGKVSSDTEIFSFITEISTVGGAKYIVSFDISGRETISTKTLTLTTGDNTVYITEYVNDEPVAVYKVVIRRRPVYTVTFDANGGTAVESVTVDEDTILDAPVTTYTGYTFTGWDYDFGTPIMSDAHITASWKANTNTKYTVEYYLENLDKSEYELVDTDELAGTTDTAVEALINEFEHFTFNSTKSVISGNIDGNGNLVLKVYYTRDTYTISTTVSNAKGGTVTVGGTYPYGTEVNLTSTVNAGYTFYGYFVGETKVCESNAYTFTVSEDIELVANIEANTNTKYTVEYYLANIESGYTMVESVELYGITDTIAFAEQKAFEHFTLWNGSSSILSGNIAGDGSLVLKLYYTRNSYDIYTNTNNNKGGDYEQICATYYYGVTIPLTATTNPGYTFLGWYEGDTLVCETADFTVTIDKNVTYTAKWEANTNTTYIVEYYLENLARNGYELKETVNLSGTTDTTANADIKSYAHFAYYSYISNASGNIDGNGTLVLKVYYQRNEYVVIADRNNNKAGTVSGSAEYAYGTDVELVAITNPGYTFLGWYEGETKICDTLKLSITTEKDVTYTAKWQANTNTAYKVEYYLENLAKDGYELLRTDALTGTTDTNATVNTTFEHFTLNIAKSTTKGNIAGDGSLVLRVYYTRDSYTINTATNIVKGGEVSGKGTYSYNSVVTLTATTNAGYTFLGWYNGDAKVSGTATFTFNATESAAYTAKWRANSDTEYKVEYYLENLTKDGYDLVDTLELTGTTDTTATADQIAYEHFVFNSGISTVRGNINGDGTLVLCLYYTRNTYTVTTATGNNKAGSVTSGKTAPYGTEITVTATTNPGYTWLGWYKGNTLVSGNASYTFNVSETITLTAKWSVNTDTFYTVEYYLQNINDDNYSLDARETLTGTTDTMANATVKTYASFVYNTSISTISGNINGDGSLVLKVYYARNSYTVTSRSNNTKAGTVTAGGTFKYGKSITLTATTKPGYTFLGWYNGSSLVSTSEVYTFNIEKNVTLTATWEANEDTQYIVEYYLENLTKTGYDLYESSVLYGTTDTTANATVKEYAHFAYKLSGSTVSGNINGDGSLVLKVYYTRNTYTVTTGAENTKAGNISNGGTYPYNTTVILTATTNPGYTFLGWYEGGVLVCDGEQFVFNADHNANYVAKWSANTDTPYSVEYYLENINKNGYELVETDNLSSTTDTTANAIIKAFEHFTYDASASVASGNINGNGALALKVYYTRNVYAINGVVENEKAGTTSGSGNYNYDKEVTLNASTHPGYTFVGWFEGDTKVCDKPEFAFKSETNITYTAKWSLNTDTPYKVEYYLENANDNGYTLYETDSLVGTTESNANAPVKTFEHFAYNASVSTTSGNISGAGSLVLRVYYTRNIYTLSNTNTDLGSISVSGSYKYGSVDAFEVTASVNKLGYEFIGWYSEGALLSNDATYVFTVDKSIEARFAVKQEMANFKFTSTATACTITGIKDKTVTEIVVPDYVTEISAGAFSGCSKLESITLPFVGGSRNATSANSLTLFGYIFGTSSYSGGDSTLQYYSSSSYATYYIPSSLKNIVITGGNVLYGSFYGCENITSLSIPNNAAYIADNAFCCCKSLTSVTIPNNVTSIGAYAFGHCYALENIYYNATFASVGERAFYEAGTSGIGIRVLIGKNVAKIPDNLFYCDAYPPKLTSLEFEENSMCRSIGEKAFGANKYLVEITIPENITTIGNNAFTCIALETIHFNATEITKLGDSVFYNAGSNANGITLIIGESVTKIPSNMFYALTSSGSPASAKIKQVSFEEGSVCTSIGDYAFKLCTSLTSVTIPDSVTSIGYYAFYQCTSLTIYCEAASKPSGWDYYWNPSNCPVVWGYKET